MYRVIGNLKVAPGQRNALILERRPICRPERTIAEALERVP